MDTLFLINILLGSVLLVTGLISSILNLSKLEDISYTIGCILLIPVSTANIIKYDNDLSYLCYGIFVLFAIGNTIKSHKQPKKDKNETQELNH